MVTLFAQVLTREMHLISILSIFLTDLGIFQQPQLIWYLLLNTVGLVLIMTTFLLDIPCSHKHFSTKKTDEKTDENILKIYGFRICIKVQQESITNDM